MDVSFLSRDDGEKIAYIASAGKSPTVVWLGGFKSDMTGTKAQALESYAQAHGFGFVRFDYFAHGQSSGDFRKGTISRWRNDALAVIDQLTKGPLILVGSSMGGWISLLVAMARAERIAGIMLIAPAPDFTQALMWEKEFTPEIKAEILEKGEWLRASEYDPEPYPITRALIEDGRNNLVMDKPLEFDFPVRIVQGMQDPDVPWLHAKKLAEHIRGDARIELVGDGDHRLSTPADIALLEHTLGSLLV